MIAIALAFMIGLSTTIAQSPVETDNDSCQETVNITDKSRLLEGKVLSKCPNNTYNIQVDTTKKNFFLVAHFKYFNSDKTLNLVEVTASEWKRVFSAESSDTNEYLITNSKEMNVTAFNVMKENYLAFNLSLSVHDSGVVNSSSGSISAKDKDISYFELNAPAGNQVTVNVTNFKSNKASTITFYEGFSEDKVLANFTDPLQLYKVFSQNQKMLVVVDLAEKAEFNATVTSVPESTFVLSEEEFGFFKVNDKSDHTWIIKPSQSNHFNLIALHLDTITLNKPQYLAIYSDLVSKTPLFTATDSILGQRSIFLPSKNGARIEFVQPKNPSTPDVKLTYQLVSDCGGNENLKESLYVTSPGYPTQYYNNAICKWNVTNNKNLTHLVMNKVDLALGDTITANNMMLSVDDVVLSGQVNLELNTTLNEMTDSAHTGFFITLNSIDCGGAKTVPNSINISNTNAPCVWTVIAKRNNGEINNINFNITVDEKVALIIYDGGNSSAQKLNYTLKSGKAQLTSRTNKLLFVINGAEKVTNFKAEFASHDCQKSEQCGNGICMHSEWICDGKNDCGDWSDEKNCLPSQICGNEFVTNETITITRENITLLNDKAVNCRWLFNTTDKRTLVASVEKSLFTGPLDTFIILDGSEEDSLKLASATNETTLDNGVIVTSSKFMRIQFFSRNLLPTTDFIVKISAQEIGKRVVGKGKVEIPSKRPQNETIIFALQAEEDKQINVTVSLGKSALPDWSLTFYDGFTCSGTPLAVRSSKQVNNPVISRSGQMLVKAEEFHDISSATIGFESIPSGFNFINQSEAGSLYLMNSTKGKYTWQIRPAINAEPNSVIFLSIDKLILLDHDSLNIYLDDDRQNAIVRFDKSIKSPVYVQARLDKGFYVEYETTRARSDSNSFPTLAASYEVVPGCNSSSILNDYTVQNITSPNHPNVYPINAECWWKFTIPKGKYAHLFFSEVNLTENNPIRILLNGAQVAKVVEENPDDIIVTDGQLEIDWNSITFKGDYTSHKGFFVQLELYDCGGLLGEKNSTIDLKKQVNTTHCIWLVKEPNKVGNDFVAINVTIDKEPSKEIWSIHDGGSIRSPLLKNDTKDILSRMNKIIFVYKFDSSKKTAQSDGVHLTYDKKLCNESCNNTQTCMHEDWKCNGINDCGDNSDEIFCGQKPPPPPPSKSSGVSGGWLAFGIIFGILFGIILAIAAPFVYKKITGRDFSYRRFTSSNDE